MSSKINSGIFFAIAALTLMVAGTLYGGITSANAQQSTNVGNFASTTQGNNVGTATAAIGVSSTATGGAGGQGGTGGPGGIFTPGGVGGVGGAGGAATSAASNTGDATVAIAQSNTAETTQSIEDSFLIGANVEKKKDNNGCPCPTGAQTANVGNFATTTQGNNVGSATAAIGVSSSATGGAGGVGGTGGAAGLFSTGGTGGVGGAGGAANSAASNSGDATVAISQSNTASTTQSITQSILAGINFR